MNLLLKFVTVGSGTLVSRVLGFVREIFMASALGTGPIADAFNAAFLLPNTFRRLFAEGAFNTAFVPLFAKKTEENNPQTSKIFSEEVFSILFSSLLILTILMELCMPWIVSYALTPGFSHQQEKYEITVKLATLMFPYLICMSLAAMISGMLNSLRHYFAAALAPVFLNLILILILLYAHSEKYAHTEIAFLLGWGVLASGLVQLGIVWFALQRIGISIRWRLPRFTQNVKDLLLLAFPAVITGGVTQINTLAGTAIASKIDSAISALSYADRIHQLPLGIVGISVAIVLLPELTRALKAHNIKEAHNLQNEAIEFTLFLTLPASTGLFILSEPIVRTLYERGEFAINNSTSIVSPILALFSLGLPAFVLIKAFTQGFVAREDTFTPMVFALISMIINILLAFVFSSSIGAQGIALAGAVAGWINAGMLSARLFQRGYWKPEKRLGKNILRMVGACGIMALVLLQAMQFFSEELLPSAAFYIQAGTLMLLTGAGAIFYLTIVCSSKSLREHMFHQILNKKPKKHR